MRRAGDENGGHQNLYYQDLFALHITKLPVVLY